jgi:hypothetical protein
MERILESAVTDVCCFFQNIYNRERTRDRRLTVDETMRKSVPSQEIKLLLRNDGGIYGKVDCVIKAARARPASDGAVDNKFARIRFSFGEALVKMFPATAYIKFGGKSYG